MNRSWSYYRQKAFFTKCLFVYLLCRACSPSLLFAQDSVAVQKLKFLEVSPFYNKSRVQLAGYTTLGLYAVSIAGLYQLWYKDYELEGFHFFNDNAEWQQMDKVGHTFSAYTAGRQGYNVCHWAGMSNQKAAWIGGNLGWVFLATIEVLDGFSSGWGFSSGDIIANTVGSASFIAQQLTWNEQRLEFKLSYHESPFAQYRPDQLGSDFQEKIFKDYNGQTLWISGNIRSFLQPGSTFPRWINVAVGYGAEGMTGARWNPSEYNGQPIPAFQRYRQFYLAPDIDFTKIKTRSRALKFFFEVTRYIKFPLPALEFNTRHHIVFHGLYF